MTDFNKRVDTLVYMGHIINGSIVLDHPVDLPEGMVVSVSVDAPSTPEQGATPLRGTHYKYDDPFEPAMPPEEWNAIS